MLKLLAMSITLFLAMIMSHFLIYKALIVPQLPNLKSVPLSWWLGVDAAELVVFVAFGLGLKSWRQLMSYAIAAGIIQQIFGYILATSNEPGHLKSYEDPLMYWTVGLVAVSVISAILFSIGMLVSKAVGKTEHA